jgi:AcrR family transcriptional regulator
MSETKRVNHRGVERRKALVDAAVELWSSTGYRGTGITAVAELAGVTPAGLLHHFGTKDHFLLAVVEELDRRTLQAFPHSAEVRGAELFDLLPDLARYPSEQPALWRLLLMLQAENFDAESPAYDYFVARQAVIHELIADALRRGQADGELRSDFDPSMVAAECLAFLLGLQMYREHGPHSVELVTATRDFADRLRRDLTVAR